MLLQSRMQKIEAKVQLMTMKVATSWLPMDLKKLKLGGMFWYFVLYSAEKIEI